MPLEQLLASLPSELLQLGGGGGGGEEGEGGEGMEVEEEGGSGEAGRSEEEERAAVDVEEKPVTRRRRYNVLYNVYTLYAHIILYVSIFCVVQRDGIDCERELYCERIYYTHC